MARELLGAGALLAKEIIGGVNVLKDVVPNATKRITGIGTAVPTQFASGAVSPVIFRGIAPTRLNVSYARNRVTLRGIAPF